MITIQEKITLAQEILRDGNYDGCLLYDFHGTNEIALRFLELPEDVMLTRRCFYWIPANGNPKKIVHKIESTNLDHLPGEKLPYLAWKELHEALSFLKSCPKILMEYSPHNAIPYLSKVDGGMLELIRSYGCEVFSSEAFMQVFQCMGNEKSLKLHCEAADVLLGALDIAWTAIAKAVTAEKSINEYDIQQLILAHFEDQACVTEGAPIVAVNAHAADPHYVPSKVCSAEIKRGDFVLIDLWCKKDLPNAYFADLTHVGVVAEEADLKHVEIFNHVRDARDAAVQFVKDRLEKNEVVMGCEVDDACRQVIKDAGYAECFIHRTGHSIDTELHGCGTHIDNLETEDRRSLCRGMCFSIEPGIYLEGDFGVRLECDVHITHAGQLIVTGDPQSNLKCILAQENLLSIRSNENE